MSADRPTLPPVRLHSDAELARDALSAPLFARAAQLARWAEAGVPVGVGGELLEEQLPGAVDHLGLAGDEDGVGYAAEAWQLAVDTGLVEIEESAEDGDELPDDAATGTAAPGEELSLLTSGSPQDILDIWLGGMETVLADAVAPDLSDIADQIAEGSELDLDAIDWNPEEEAELLDGILGNLYLLTALNEDPEQSVPLPALAASMIVPDDMDEPTDDILEEVSEAMMRLDDQFRVLQPIGLVDYQPVDEALIEELDEDGSTTRAAEPLEDEDVSRYGMVRLTPLGVYAVRARMLDAGVDAPAVGDLTDKGADVLLDALPDYPEPLAQAESEQWLAARTPVDAALGRPRRRRGRAAAPAGLPADAVAGRGGGRARAARGARRRAARRSGPGLARRARCGRHPRADPGHDLLADRGHHRGTARRGRGRRGERGRAARPRRGRGRSAQRLLRRRLAGGPPGDLRRAGSHGPPPPGQEDRQGGPQGRVQGAVPAGRLSGRGFLAGEAPLP